MALDVGAKRIGIALADPSGTFAMPLGTVERTNRNEDLARVRAYLESYGVRELVVGEPLTLVGERGVASQTMDRFVERLQEIFAGPIHRIDERMTTAQVTKTLIAADVSRAKRRQAVDKMAAAVILDVFLARRRNAPQ